MHKPRQEHRTLFLFLITLLLILTFSSCSHDTKTERKSPNLNLAIGFRLGLLMDPALENSFAITKTKILEYGIDEVRIYGGGNAITYKYLDIEGFPEIKKTGNKEEFNHFKEGLKWFEDNGIRVTLSGGEPSLPGVSYHNQNNNSFFDIYPEAVYLDNGILWKFYEERTYSLFKTFPEVDATDYFLWETPLLDDLNYFTGLKWQKSVSWHKGNNQYYSQADYLTEFLAAVTRGATRAGKNFSIMTFSHYPHQEKLLIESLKELEKRKVPLLMVHKMQSGDWDPYRGPNNVMMQTKSKSSMLFDGIGEYWGRSLIPYCFPEEIQSRLLHALEHNQNIHTLAMRSFWENDQTLFNNYNEINLFALAQLADNPHADIDSIWMKWANNKFGPEPAPGVIKALKRSNDIGNLVYYYKGIWVQEHSRMASLDYITAQVLHTGRAMTDWYPDSTENNKLINEFMYSPSEETINLAVKDRKDAIVLCDLSIADIELVKKDLEPEEYKKLNYELNLQRDFADLSVLHIEAYLRYVINRDNPSPDNSLKLKNCLNKMEEMALLIDNKYGKDNYLLSGDRVRQFVRDIE